MSDARTTAGETQGTGRAGKSHVPGPHLARISAEGDQCRPASTTAPVQLAAVGLWKRYRKGHVEIPVLRGVDFEVRRGEFVSIIGQSGSGKSTLLHLLGTLDAPDEGEVIFQGER